MIPSVPPTGGTDPKVNVVQPLTNQPVNEETPPPLFNAQLEQTQEEETPPPLISSEEETPPPLAPQEPQRTSTGQFDFGQIVTAQKDATAKVNAKKTPQELFAKPAEQENVAVKKFEDLEIGAINELHNPKLSPNTGTVKVGETGAPVIHKEGDLKALRYTQYPSDLYINPDVLRTSVNFPSTETGLAFLEAGRIPPLSAMSESARETFTNLLGADNMPEEKMVYPDVKADNLDAVFKEVSDYDDLLSKSLLQNQEELNSLSEKIKGSKSEEEYKDYKLKWEDLASKDIYFNVWKSVVGDSKTEVYPEEITSKIQEIRNNQKYETLKKSGFVSEIASDVPDNIKNFLKSNEYINSTAKQKKIYAKMLWRTNMDKYATPQDLYSKISNTFTPSVSLLFLKQKAKDNLKGINLFQLTRESEITPTTNVAKIREYVSHARELYSKIIDADFENDNNAWQALGYSLKHHGSDAIPFLSGAFRLGDSIQLYSVVNKASKSGIESLSKEEKILFDAYSVFNSYNQMSKPDSVTQAINAIPGLISFIGELGMAGVPMKALNSATSKLMRAGASATMKVAIEKSPSIIGSSVDILKAMNGITGGSLTKLAGNASGLLTFPGKTLATTLMARGLESTSSAINMTTDTPVLHLDENDMKYISESIPTDRPDFWKNMQTSLALESANVGTIEAGKLIGEVQNDAIIRLMSKFDKSSPARKLLNLLKANQLEEMAAQKGMPTGIEAFIQRAKSLNPATIIPDMAAFGVLLPRAEHVILGTKDGFWDNPTATLKEDIQNAAICLAAPVLGGKLIGIASLSNFGRVIFRNEAKFADFQNRVFSSSKEEFMSQEFQDKLRSEIEFFAKTGSKEKDRFGKLMQARLEHRLDFENGKIEGAVGDTYSEYIANARASQAYMDKILDQVRDGKVDKGLIEDAISTAADAIDRRQFEFHKDLINAYETSGKENETLKEYVDKHKKVYFDIKQEFAALHSLRTAPDWALYEKRINDAMLPSDYKKELKLTYDILKSEWEADAQKIYGQNVKKTTDLPELMRVIGTDNSHAFTKNEDGTYRFISSDEASAHADIDFALKGMGMSDVMNLYNVSRNSDMTQDMKDKVSNSVKERAISEFENNEFFSDFGGRENMSQILDAINTVSQTSPLTPEQKSNLTNAIQNVFEVELRRDASLNNYESVKSAIQRLVQNSQIVDVKNVLDFHRKMSNLVMREAVKNMSNSQLEYEIKTANGDTREILADEVNERKNLEKTTAEDLKKLMEALNLQPIHSNVDFETLQRNNPSVRKISEQVFELQKLGFISEKGRNTMEGILCSINPDFINIKSISIKKTDKSEASRYNDKSKSIVVTYHDGMTESQLIAEMAEEILHSVEHNLATSIGNGGLVGDFLLTDAQIEEISGTNRADAVANIARWYKSKDYDYNRFLQLKDKMPSEMTEDEKKEFYQIKDMLLRFGTKYGQKWDNLRFIDKENKLGWEFTTESLVRNWNRYNQMRTLSRPDGRRYTSAEAFYYSAYSHEYFARTLGDYQISDVSNRISGDAPIEGMIQKASNYISKFFKLPVLTKLFRSETFEGNEKKLRDMMSPADESNLRQMVSTQGEALNPEMKADFDKILKEIPSDNHIELYRSLQDSPQELNNFISSLSDNATKLGYDKAIVNDILSYLNKEIAITGKEIEAFRDEDERELRYVSNTVKALEGLNINKTSGANWLDKILSSGGKKVEIERYGLDTFLKENKNPTKQDILDYLSDKVMKVKDVVLGGEISKEKSEAQRTFEDTRNNLDSRGIYVNVEWEDYFGYTVEYLIHRGQEESIPISIEPDENSGEAKIADLSRNEIRNLLEIDDSGLQSIERLILKNREAFLKSEEYRKEEGNESEGNMTTRWSSYTTFPLNNYRELLPVIDTEKKLFSHESHFSGIKNQLYHNRLNDVVTESGKKLLLSEEMQGDWKEDTWKFSGDEQRDVYSMTNHISKLKLALDGFNSELIDKPFDKEIEKNIKDIEKLIEVEQKGLDEYVDKIRKEKSPPFQKTSDWVRAAIKRMIKMAVDEGKDGIAWTPAHIQVERWSNATRAVVDNIHFEKVEGEKDLDNKSREVLKINASKEGNAGENFVFYKEPDGSYKDMSGKDAKEYFGSEIMKQIESGESKGNIEGENIIVGGEGYKDIYDKTAVDVANKIGKKYGVQVTKEKVGVMPEYADAIKNATGERDYVEVHSLLFNDKLIEEVKKQSELEIFAKRDEEKTPPTPTGEFKNIADLIDNSIKVENEKQIEAYRGIEGLKNLEKTNPEEYKRLFKLLEEAKSKFSNPDDKSYYVGNYLLNGWFREKLKGKEFFKSKIDDSKMTILQQSPAYKAPSTSRVISNVIRFINGNADGVKREIAKNDVDEAQRHNIFLDDIISHKELFQSYPELRDAKIEFYWGDDSDVTDGFHYETNGETRFAVNVNKITTLENPTEEFKETLLHEIQHKIQEIEGFHRGTSEEYFKDNFFVYNVYQAKERGDAFVIEQLSKPENKQLASLVDKISEGKELAPSEFIPKNFMTAKSFADSRIQILSYMKGVPEYMWAYDMYRRAAGEIEAFDINNKDVLPATLLLTLGETIKQEGYYYKNTKNQQLIRPQDIIPILEKDNTIEAKRDDKYIKSPVDISWFQSLFEDKDAIVGTREIERVVKDIDDNINSFLGGNIKSLAQAKRAASAFAHNVIDIWKARMIDKAIPKSSTYERKEIARLVSTPFRKKLQDYSKDIAYINNVVTNANFRKAIADTKREQIYARNRFLRYNKDDVQFYSSVNKLTSINTRMFENVEELNKYNELLTSKPENVNVSEFKQRVDDVWNEYLDWKKQFNDQYTGTEEAISEDESILNEQLFYDKKQIIKDVVSTQLVNRGVTDFHKNYIDAFAGIDIDQMDANELREYESSLKYLLLNPEKVNHKVVKLVNKYQAQNWFERASEELSRKYIDIINRKSLPSTNSAVEYMKGLVPGIGTKSGDKLGNISPFNAKSLLEIGEGMSKELPLVLRSEITEPINRDYQQFLINKADAIRKISAKGKYSISEMHRVGIKALLDQKPQFALTANALKVLSEQGINIDNLAVGEVISSKNTEPDKVAVYQYILGQSNQMIKESILISFGIKPDETWTDNEMKEILGDVSVMSRRSESAIKEELDNLLKDSGVESLPELLDAIESGAHSLTESEGQYLNLIRETMNDVKDGKYSRGLDLRSASEDLYGIEFQEIENYFPLLRYKTYLTTEKYLDPEHNEDANDAKVFYGIYNDFQMNTQFLEKRKPTVMALQTNAYEAVAKRLDQQIFYLNHVEHQNYLKSLFRTDAWYGKGDMFNTEATNQIVDLLNGNYNRGINEARAEIMKDVSANFIYNAVQRYKALYVGDWLKSPGQLSTVIFNMAKMKGNVLNKVKDVASGSKMMVSSYVEGSPENIFLSKYAPEVYYRGLNTYDFVGLDSGDNYTETVGEKGFMSEAARNSGKVSGVAKGLERGLYRTNKSRLGVIASEIKNPYSHFGAEWNLAGLKFHDRVAARASFFSSYKNYCDYLGVDASMENPNMQAVNKALEDVRETQFTDNPLQRSGLSYNLVAGGSKQFPGDWTMINLLAFKSFSINERQTLMKASERLKNAVYEKRWDDASEEASYFAYSFASKMAFNYIKLVCQKYILSAVAASALSDDKDQRQALIKESIGTSTQLSNVALHSFLDYFTLAEPVKWGTSIGLKFLEEKIKGELSKEDKDKYRGSDMLNQDMLSGFADDVAKNIVVDAAETLESNKEYGMLDAETLRDDARFALILSQIRYGLPGASIGNDFLKEMNKQRKMMERSKKNTEDSLYK